MKKYLISEIAPYFIALLLLGQMLLMASSAFAATKIINSNTNWNSISGGAPGTGDTVIVGNGATLTVNSNSAVAGNIILGASNGTGRLRFSNNNRVLTVSGTVTFGAGGNTGTLDMSNGGRLNVQGFVYVAGTFTPGAGTVNFTADNTLPNNATFSNFNNLMQSASATTSLSRNLTVDGTLTLNGGLIDAGNFTLEVSGSCTSDVVRPSNGGYVSGLLRLAFASGTTTCTYPLGSATGYAPISLTVSNSGGGSLSAASIGSEHPQISSSTLDTTRDVNRHWQIWQSGDNLNVTSYSASFSYASGDLDSAATPSSFLLGRYAASAWSLPTPISNATNQISVSGQSGPINAVLGFAAGQAKAVCNPPADISATFSCVCEDFSRSNLNPSAIFGSDWALSSSGGSFGLPRIINSGRLRLTDNSATVATAATVPANFPAAGNLIVVEFKSYSYNGSGADGMALTLSDASILPQPGAFGGSLGYAQKVGSDCTVPGGCAGFSGGWMGVALDEYGNFSSGSEGRVGGPGSRADAVAVRGSGSGASSAATNYPYLDGTGTLSPGVDNAASSSAAYGHAYRVMVDARSYTPASKTATVSVYRDTSGAGNFSVSNRLLNFDAYQKNPSQAAVPANWKLSFTGSTGGSANIHEIAGLKICAQYVSPPTSFIIEVDNVNPGTCSTVPSGRPQITVTAIDINRNVITNYNKTVTLNALLSSGATSSGIWSIFAGNGNLSGNQYTFSAADQGVAKFVLTDSVQEDVLVGVQENGTAFSVTYDTALQYRGGSFSIANIDPLAADTAGGVVAGRPHQFSITRSTACGVDTSYSGAKLLDGWYSAVAAAQPAGAAAPRLCQMTGATCLLGTGTCSTLPSTAPAISSSSNNLPSLNFTSGVGKFCLQTSDVGRYALNLRDDSIDIAPVAGTSANLTARPFAVVVSNVQQGLSNFNPASDANSNPANTSTPENAPIFTSAGSSFSATVGGYLWHSSADANGDGLPDSAATFAEVITAGLASHYADNVSLASSAQFVPQTGVQGSLAGSAVAVVAGQGTVNNLSYSEVGSFALAATPSNNYLNSSVNLASRVALYTNPNLATRTAWVGRFIPHHFKLTAAASLINRSDINAGAGCSPASTFTYMGESMYLSFGLSAVNLQDNLTSNYAGNYAKLNNGNWLQSGVSNSIGLNILGKNVAAGGGTCNAVFDQATPSHTSFRNCSATTPADVLRASGPRFALVTAPASPSWLAGQASFNAHLYLQRADTADGPYLTTQLGIAPQDAEGVSLLSSQLDMDADQNGTNERLLLQSLVTRYGRMKIDNAYGSDLLSLPVKVQAQYWNGSAYINATDDHCTPLLGSNFSMNGYVGTLNAGNMNSANIPANSGTMFSGAGKVKISKPSGTIIRPGSVSLNSNLNYLPGSGRISFGLYKSGPVIYIREIY